MEQNRDFQRAISILKNLQTKQSNISESKLTQEYKESTSLIEEHFTSCVKSLIARKDALLLETKSLFQRQQEQSQQANTELEETIKGCKEVIVAGTKLFKEHPNIASSIWKGVSNLNPIPQVHAISIALPTNIHDIIADHGKVDNLIQEPIITAGEVTTLAKSTLETKEGISIYQFNFPIALCFNPLDNSLYFCDYGVIRRVSVKGEVLAVHKGVYLNGIAFSNVEKCLYVSSDHKIERISDKGVRSLVAGSYDKGFKDGVKSSARFNSPRGISVDQQTGNIYVCDRENRSIRKITPEGDVSTLAGSRSKGHADGAGKLAQFKLLTGMAWSGPDSLIVCDDERLRKVSLVDGHTTSIATIPGLHSVTTLQNGDMIASSLAYHEIHFIHQEGTSYQVKSFAGKRGESGGKDGLANQSRFYRPCGLAVDSTNDRCFVCESGIRRVRVISINKL